MSCYFRILFNNLKTFTSKNINELFLIRGGFTPLKGVSHFFSKQGIPWIKIEDLTKQKNKFVSNGSEYLTQKGFESCGAKAIPENTILLSNRGTLGKMAISLKKLCVNTSFFSLIPKPEIGLTYSYFLIKESINKILLNSTGTAQKQITKEILKKIEVKLASFKDIKKFSNFCDPIFQLQKNNEQEIRELMNLQKITIEKLN